MCGDAMMSDEIDGLDAGCEVILEIADSVLRMQCGNNGDWEGRKSARKVARVLCVENRGLTLRKDWSGICPLPRRKGGLRWGGIQKLRKNLKFRLSSL